VVGKHGSTASLILPAATNLLSCGTSKILKDVQNIPELLLCR